ncbi:MAG: hypothetical protein GY714_09150 [Desulfobacterales bacterium]|nr:hypothetical protein [Desulfobacterales bacterium]
MINLMKLINSHIKEDEFKVWELLLKEAIPALETEKTFRIKLKKFEDPFLEEKLKILSSTTIELQSKDIHFGFGLITEFKIIDGVCEFDFARSLKKYIIVNLKNSNNPTYKTQRNN